MKRWWLGLCLLLLAMVFLLPPSNVPDIKGYEQREAFHQKKIAQLERRIAVLDSRDSVWGVVVAVMRDSLKREREVVRGLRERYQAVREEEVEEYTEEVLDSIFGLPVAGDQLPVVYTMPIDTVWVLLHDRRELAAARPLIAYQEELINMGLRYESAADSLLSIRLKSILERDSIIYSERKRFTNMVEMKDATIRHERREKRRWKAAAIVIGTLAVLEKIFSP